MNPAAPVTTVRICATIPREAPGPTRTVVAMSVVPVRVPARIPGVAAVAVALIALQLAVRAVLAFGGYFYWDDLILVGRAGTHPLLSMGYLLDDHDGHVMPGAFLLSGVITRLAPLVWTWPAVSLLVMQLIASLALLRTLRVILGWRPVLLVPLCFALFTPLGVPAFAWWAAALNYLPMAAALAWVCGDAIMLVRTGNQWYSGTGMLAYLGGLLFFEKAAVIPVTAFGVAALLAYARGESAPLRTVWRRGRRLWASALVLTALWVALYLRVVNQRRWSRDLSMTWDLLRRSVTHGIVPGLAGGPWQWQRWAPASPWAVPPVAAMVLGWAVLILAVAASMLRKRRVGAVWLTAAGYALACQVPIYLMRSSAFTALELAQTLRYLADLVVVLAILAAVGFCAPNRPGYQWLDASPARTAAAFGVGTAFVASSLFSTATFLHSWQDNPTKPYLQNAVRGLAEAREAKPAPMLDQEVDPLILQRVVGPENLASHMFALLRDTPVSMPLDGPLLPADWTAEINYLANGDGSIVLSLPVGPETKVTVKPGLNRVYVRLSGAGDVITVRATTAALAVCLASGPVGYLAPH